MRSFLLALVSLCACSEEIEEGVVVCIDAEDRAAYDEIDVTIAFSGGDRAPLCQAGTLVFPDVDKLPVCIGLKPGPVYGAYVALRAAGIHAGEELSRREITVPFPHGEQIDYDMEIQSGCGACAEGSHCVNSAEPGGPDECEVNPTWDFFGQGSITPDPVPCLPED